MVPGRRSTECDFCGVPYGAWVASLGMALCPECERTGAERPAREPVLVGDVLAGLDGLGRLAGPDGPLGASAPPEPERSRVRRDS
ncbi:hypothetical protein [Streptomyces sp. NPDC004291]